MVIPKKRDYFDWFIIAMAIGACFLIMPMCLDAYYHARFGSECRSMTIGPDSNTYRCYK